jgi:hypothetical protein
MTHSLLFGSENAETFEHQLRVEQIVYDPNGAVSSGRPSTTV